MGRFTLILVVGFSIFAGVMKLNYSHIGRQAQSLSSDRFVACAARNVTTSAISLCLMNLSQDFTWRDGFTDLDILDGTASATIEDSTNDAQIGINHVRITVTGNFADTTRQASVLLRKSAFSEFAYFTDDEPQIYFVTGDTIDGPMHTNGQFHIYGDPVFYGMVSSHRSAWHGWGNPEFHGGTNFGIDEIELPVDLTILEGKAQNGGSYFEGETLIEFKDDGTFDWTVYHWIRVGHPPQDVMVVDSSGNVVISTMNGVIATSSGNDIHVKGTVDGQVTILGEENIWIEDDVLYKVDPRNDPQADDMLGLIAKKDVIVADNSTNRNDCIIHATIMALDLSFKVENYNQGNYRGILEILGGVVQQRRGPVGTMRNGNVGTGYQKYYQYDHRFRSFAPPFYPVFSKTTIVSWYE